MSADESQPTTKPSILRRVGRWSLRLVGGLVVLIVIALLVIQTQFFKDKLRDQLQEILKESLAGRVEIESIEGNLLTHVKIKGVKVFDAKDNLAVRVSQAEADYQLLSLIHGGLIFDRVSIDGALGIVRYYEDGTLNLATITKPTPEDPNKAQSTFAVEARLIQVSDSSALFADQREGPVKADISSLIALLNDPKTLKPKGLEALVAPKIEQARPTSQGALVPTAAAITNLGLSATFLLDATGAIQVTSKKLDAKLWANTWVRPETLASRDLNVAYTKELVHLRHQELSIGKETGWKDLKAGVWFAQGDQSKDQIALDALFADIPTLRAKRETLLSIFPTQDIQSDLDASLVLSGTPKSLKAKVESKFLPEGGSLSVWASVDDLLSVLLEGKPLESANDAMAKVYLKTTNLNASAILGTLPRTDVTLRADAWVNGVTLEGMEATVDLKVDQSKGFGYTINEGSVEARFKDKKLTVLPSFVKTPQGNAALEGFATLGGTFDLKLEALSKPTGTQTIDIPNRAPIEHGDIKIKAHAWGELEQEGDSPIEIAKEAHVRATWELDTLKVPKVVTLGSTQGRLDADLVPTGNLQREFSYDLQGEVSELDTPDLTARSAKVTSKGDLRVSPPLDVASLMAKINATLRLQLSGFRGFGARLGRADVSATLQPGAGGRLAYDARVSAGGVRLSSADLSVQSAKLNSTGSVGLDMGETPGLDFISAKGDAEVKKLKQGENSAQEAEVTFDVQGRPPGLSGQVSLNGKEIKAGQEEISRLGANVDLASDGRFKVEAKASRKNQESLANVKLTAQGKLGDKLQSVIGLDAALYDLDKSETQPIWEMEDASVSWKGGALKFDQVSLVNGDQRLSVEGNLFGRGKQNFSASAQNIELGQLRQELGLQQILPPIQGMVEKLELEVSGTAKEPVVIIDILLKDFYYQAVGPLTLALKGRYKDQALVLQKLDLDGFGMDLVRLNGKVPVDIDLEAKDFKIFWSRPILLTLMIDPIELDKLSKGLTPMQKIAVDMSGKLEGGGIINGTLRTPRVDITIKGDDVTVEKGTVIGSQQSDFEIKDLSFLTKLEYNPPQGTKGGLQAKMDVQWGGDNVLDLDVSLPLPLSEWAYQTVERGAQVDFVRESFTQPLFMEAKVNKLELQKITDTNMIAPLKLKGLASMDLKGEGTLGAPRILVEMGLDQVQATGQFGKQELDLKGIVFDLQSRLEPTSKTTTSFDLKAGLSLGGAQILNTKNSIRLPLQSWIRRTLLKSEEIDFASEMMDQPYLVNLNVKDLDLQTIAISPLFTKPDAAGIVNATVQGEGVMRDPKLNVQIGVGEMGVGNKGEVTSKGGFGWDRYRDIVIKVDAHLEDKMFELKQFFVNWDTTDILTAFGKVPLPIDTLIRKVPLNDLPLDMAIEVHPIPLNKLSAVDYAFAKYSGTFRGHVLAKGSLREPDLNGRIALTNTQLSQGRLGTVSMEMHADRDILTLDAGVCEGEEDVLTLEAKLRAALDFIDIFKGTSPLELSPQRRPTDKLPAGDDFRIVAKTKEGKELNLSRILPKRLVERVVSGVKGSLKVDVKIDGTYEKPKPAGSLVLKDAAVTLTTLGRRFRDIQLAVALDSKEFNLERLQVKEGTEAKIKANGSIKHQDLKLGELGLEMKSENFNVGDFVGFPFFVDAKVKVEGDLAPTPMKATVDISGLDVQLTEDLGGDLHPTELNEDVVVIKSRNQKEEDTVEGVADELLATKDDSGNTIMAANVRVKIARDSWVRHPYGDVNFQGDITARIEGPETRLSGQVETLRGQVEFLGRIFRVNRGLVSFTGASPPEPRLQLEATYELDRSVAQALGPPSEGDPRIIIRVVGSASNPRLNLRSDPAMTDTDILYVLATNRPPSTADVGQESSVASAALSAASGVVVGLLKDELSDTLPLDFFDVLRIDTDNFEVGKYVYNGKIYLAYRYLFGSADQDGQNVYEFEYHFAPRWTLEAQGKNSTQNSELLFNVFWDLY